MITATTAPLMFVEYNYIVPTPYSCWFLGVVRSRPRRHPPRVCRIQLHCTDTLHLQVLGSGMITATTAPLMFVEYNYFVPTPYSCRFLGVVRSRPRRPHLVFVEYNYIVPTPYSCRFLGVGRSRPRRNPSCLQNTTTLYRHLTAAGSWEWYDHGHGPPRVYRIQLHCTDTLQLQVLGSGTITATTAPGTPRVCRIQLHCTDTSQLQVLGSDMITATTAPLMFVEYNYFVPTPYSCRFLGVVRSRPRRPHLVFVEYNYIVPTPYSCRFLGVGRSRPRRNPSCLQNTTTLYRHLTAASSWEWYDHGHDGNPPPPPSCLQNTTTLYRHLTAAGSWEWYDHGHDGTPRVCRIQLHCTDTTQCNYIVPTPYSCRFLGVV